MHKRKPMPAPRRSASQGSTTGRPRARISLELLDDRILPSINPIVAENQLPGAPKSQWDIVGAGDLTLQGFATEMSVNLGESVFFKIDDQTLASFRIDIYRMGYYGGLGARLIDTIPTSQTAETVQPAPLTDPATGLVDCGNWSISASWSVPTTATSGVYFAKLVREDNGGASHIVFVVRDDNSHSDVLFQTSDTTWQAYNNYGGKSTYDDNSTGNIRAYAVSYNRPFLTRGTPGGLGDTNWFFWGEYPMVRWLEANGYDVSYTSGIDTARRGPELLEHSLFLSVGHDEYWDGQQRANVEAALAAGVNLAFFSGNEMYWKIRWEPAIDGSNTPYRTMVTYKESVVGAHTINNLPPGVSLGYNSHVSIPDPSPVWTGLWRDYRYASDAKVEQLLTGQIFSVNRGPGGVFGTAIQVPEEFGKMRMWRNTTVATLGSGQVATLANGTLGYEWDEDVNNGFRPAGAIQLSSTTEFVPEKLVDPISWPGCGGTMGAPCSLCRGCAVAPGTATHSMTLYRDDSGALVFGAGTVQWAWGLDSGHDGGATVPDVRMRQATVNLFADMGIQPDSLQSGLTAAAMSTDLLAPSTTITTSLAGATITAGVPFVITGTATDSGGGLVGGAEVSVDGGLTWYRADGRANWSYTWTPTAAGPAIILARASDDSANLGATTPAVAVSVGTTPTSSSGLVAAYDFNQGAGSTLSDVSGNLSPNHGSIANATWSTQGMFGSGALSFNGIDSVVTIANSSSINLSGAYTLSAWVRPNTLTTDALIIGKEHIVEVPYSGNLQYAMYASSGTDDRPSSFIHTTTSNNYYTEAVSSLPLNAWTHVAATFDGNVIRLYVNGELAIGQTVPPSTMAISSNPLRIGGDSIYGDFFSGLIDEIRVYNRALSDIEVNNDMVRPIGGAMDAAAPTITWTGPASGSSVSGQVSLSVNAADNIVLRGVQFFVNGVPIATEDTTGPYAATWNTLPLPNGAYTITARARDAGGNTTTIAPVTLNVTNPVDTTPPAVALVFPPASSLVVGQTVISAPASDNRIVAGVQFKLNGVNIGAEDTSAPFRIVWDSTTVSDGTYSLTATARDAAGNTTTSAPLSIIVQNTSQSHQHTTVADFSAGTVSGTIVTNVSGGEVHLASDLRDDFNGTALGSNWTVTSWGDSGATHSVAGGVLTMAGKYVLSSRAESLVGAEGSISFGNSAYQHFGLATDLNSTPSTYWAIFSTMGTTGTLYARVNAAGTTTDIGIGALPSGFHRYTVEPISTGFRFLIDGVQVASINATIPEGTPLRLAASAFAAGSPPLQAEWIRWMGGVFTSSVIDAGQTANWGAATWGSTVPGGTALTVQTRSGATPAPNGTWSGWSLIGGSGGAISSPAARYIQYRTIMTTGDALITPELADITVSYTTGAPDTTPPTVTSRSPAVNATQVPVNTTVTATFNETIQQPTLIFELRDALNAIVPATLTYNPANFTATLTPASALAYSQTFTATVSGVLDASGNQIALTSWSFTTTAAPTLPSISISDVSVVEGNAGTVNAVFTVTLSAASSQVVTVTYATADGSAQAGSDYTAIASTVLTFAPGETSKPITVSVLGDTSLEGNETFFVNLTNPVNATLADGQGQGVIIDDESGLIGSDAYGYAAFTQPFEALDLVPGASGVITVRSTGNDNSNTVALSSGSTFRFYGASYTSLSISTNGLITFGGSETSPSNTALTTSPTPRTIAALWDDWVNTSGNAMILLKYQDTNSDGVNDRLIVEWNNVQGAPSSPSPVTFQTILQLNTGAADGNITFNYPDLQSGDSRANGGSATVGIKDAGTQGGNRLLVSQNNGATPYVASGSAIRITRDSVAPIVSFTSPANGSTVSGTVSIVANAADNVGVAGVQFLLDGADLGIEDTTAPYSFSWDSTTATTGFHTLSARARDVAGNLSTVTLSVTVSNVVDSTPPTAPGSLAAIDGMYDIGLTWNASTDNIGVTLYNIHRSTVSGFTPTIGNRIAQISATNYLDASLPVGTYYYLVTAQDAAGNVSSASNPATGTATGDITAPDVSISAPTAGASVSGDATVGANASDNVGVVGVQFLLNGVNLGAEDTTAPYSIVWDSRTIANGAHTLTARARDAAGNLTTSAPVSITVSNQSGLVAAYGFEEGSGVSVLDQSGNGLNGAVTNATWTTSGAFSNPYGRALTFNGSNAWVTVNDANALDLTDTMTLEAWVRPTTLNKDWRTVLLKERPNGLAYGLYASDGPNRPPAGYVNRNGVDMSTTGSSSLPLNAWSHLAATFDGVTLRLYVNAVLVSSRVLKPGTITTSGNALRIGGNSIWGEYFAGQIDEVRIYNRALTATQIATDMVTPVGGGGGAQHINVPEATAPGAGQPLTADQVNGLMPEVLNRWNGLGVPLTTLQMIPWTIRIVDLPGSNVGFTANQTIWLDRDAAGHGWFVDPTPVDDSEFSPANDSGEARERVDLLTVLAHEFGHLLGLPTTSGTDLMGDDLPLGTRRIYLDQTAAVESPDAAFDVSSSFMMTWTMSDSASRRHDARSIEHQSMSPFVSMPRLSENSVRVAIRRNSTDDADSDDALGSIRWGVFLDRDLGTLE